MTDVSNDTATAAVLLYHPTITDSGSMYPSSGTLTLMGGTGTAPTYTYTGLGGGGRSNAADASHPG